MTHTTTAKPASDSQQARARPGPGMARGERRSSSPLRSRSWSSVLGLPRRRLPDQLSGPAGTGKTTLALHVAAKLGQPVTLIHGDDEFGSSDLVGNDRIPQEPADRQLHPLGREGRGDDEDALDRQPPDDRLPLRPRARLRRVHPQPARGQQRAFERAGRGALEPAQAPLRRRRLPEGATRSSGPSSPRIPRSTPASTRARTP